MWFQKVDGTLANLDYALRIRIEPSHGDVQTSVVADMTSVANYQDVLFAGTEAQCADTMAAIASRLAPVTAQG